MEFGKIHWVGIGIAVIVITLSLFLVGSNVFFLILGIGIIVGVFPFVFSAIRETRINSEKEEMFLEFSRNLVESVKTGTSVSKSIINASNKPYGALSENICKLSNQISLGVPLYTAFQIFSKDVNNRVISRAVTMIGQAEKVGGDISGILESVTEAVSTSDKLVKERRAAISTLVLQGYIIFFVFIIIVLVMQFKILPMVSGISGGGSPEMFGSSGGGIDQKEISSAFMYLLLVQGFFSGMTIGKLSEGSIKPGIKHSFILMVASFLISVGANLLWGAA